MGRRLGEPGATGEEARLEPAMSSQMCKSCPSYTELRLGPLSLFCVAKCFALTD